MVKGELSTYFVSSRCYLCQRSSDFWPTPDLFRNMLFPEMTALRKSTNSSWQISERIYHCPMWPKLPICPSPPFAVFSKRVREKAFPIFSMKLGSAMPANFLWKRSIIFPGSVMNADLITCPILTGSLRKLPVNPHCNTGAF